MCYYLMGRYMNVRRVRCEIVVALELRAGGRVELFEVSRVWLQP